MLFKVLIHTISRAKIKQNGINIFNNKIFKNKGIFIKLNKSFHEIQATMDRVIDIYIYSQFTFLQNFTLNPSINLMMSTSVVIFLYESATSGLELLTDDN